MLGGLATVLGALLDGSPGGVRRPRRHRGGGRVFGLGALVVDRVAGALPSAALLVALMTYTLQVVLLAALFLALSDSGLLDDGLDRRWLAGTIIAGTFVWLGAHVLLAVRARIPAYELPDGGGSRGVNDEGAGCYCPGRDGSAETPARGTGRTPIGRPLAGLRVPRLGGAAVRPDRVAARPVAGTSFLVVVGILVGITLGMLMTWWRFRAPGARHDPGRPTTHPHHQT